MDVVILKENSPEWNYMWNWLGEHPINKGIDDPTTALNKGESWQYMGSFRNKDEVVHSFRHRNHPVANGLINISVIGSDLFNNDSIEPKQ